ncbi:hypothetical protein BKI52_24165 [marine bacterium AO1-C]|nr:hypothetical protein BKI52_24165 [marine bacterium AO1-C]
MKHLLFTLWLCSTIICISSPAKSQNNPTSKKNDSLKSLLSSYQDSLAFYKLGDKMLRETKLKLEDKLWATENQLDSVQKLLNNARYRERRYRTEAARLKNLLEGFESKVDSLQKAYDEIAVSSGATLAEYRKQIEQLTTERNNLANKVQHSSKQSVKPAKENGMALFAVNIQATSGKIYQGRFKTITRALLADRIRVIFTLTRAPSSNEKIVIKLFDSSNQEIALINDYQNKSGSLTATQQLIIKPAIDAPQKFSRGNYSIRLFLSNTKQGIQNQPIGIGEFSLH